MSRVVLAAPAASSATFPRSLCATFRLPSCRLNYTKNSMIIQILLIQTILISKLIYLYQFKRIKFRSQISKPQVTPNSAIVKH